MALVGMQWFCRRKLIVIFIVVNLFLLLYLYHVTRPGPSTLADVKIHRSHDNKPLTATSHEETDITRHVTNSQYDITSAGSTSQKFDVIEGDDFFSEQEQDREKSPSLSFTSSSPSNTSSALSIPMGMEGVPRERERERKTQAKETGGAFTWDVKESSRNRTEVQHIVFIKVHKTASTTVYNLLIRFAFSRHLNVMFPSRGHLLSQNVRGIPSNLSRSLAPHPPSPPFLFDVLCNHVVWDDRQDLTPYLHADTKYLAIVREPWEQVKSAYLYYGGQLHLHYLTKAPSFQVFVKNQSRFEVENPLRSRTNNRMSIDMGLPPNHLTASGPVDDCSYVKPFLRQLDLTFHLVLVTERFDESIILLKRTFGWTTKDVLYRKLNRLKVKVDKTEPAIWKPEEEDIERFRRFQCFDVAVYEYYVKVFQKKVDQEGDGFQDEVNRFLEIEEQVSEFCDGQGIGPSSSDSSSHSSSSSNSDSSSNSSASSSSSSSSYLHIPASEWNAEFVFHLEECSILSVAEITMNNWARKVQLARLATVH